MARIEKVFTDISTIAHLWANQSQDEARNSGNFFFTGDTIYSYGYHFPIAKHVTNSDGERATLFTERTYSVTTSSHINVVRHAANHLNLVYIADVDYHNPYVFSEDLARKWQKKIEGIATNLPRARKPEIYLNQIEAVNTSIRKYAEFFKFDIPPTLQAAMAITDKDAYAGYAEAKAVVEFIKWYNENKK